MADKRQITRLIGTLVSLLGLVLGITSWANPGADVRAAEAGLRVFVPAYWSSADIADWERLVATLPPGSLVASGLGYPQPAPRNRNAYMIDVLARLHAKNIQVACYVPTNYGAVDSPASDGEVHPLARIRREIDDCYATYDFDGIYLDNVEQNPCPHLPDPPSCANAAYVATFYTGLRDYVKAKTGARGTLVVLNAAGRQHLPETITWGDLVQTVEYPYARQDVSGAPTYVTGYAQPDFVQRAWPASKVIHVVTGLGKDDALPAQHLAAGRNAGWVYLTDLSDPRQYYNALPDAQIWETLVGRAQGAAQDPPLPGASQQAGTRRCATFYDMFTGSGPTAQWVASAGRGGAARQVQNRLELTPGTTAGVVSNARVTLSARCSLLDSGVSVEVLNAGSTADGENAQLAVSDGTYNNLVALQQQNNRLIAYAIVGGKRTNLATVSYDPVLATWWRLREAGGALNFEYSADTTAWTTLATMPTAGLFSLASVVPALETASFGPAPAAVPVHFDNFNVVLTPVLATNVIQP